MYVSDPGLPPELVTRARKIINNLLHDIPVEPDAWDQ